MRHLNHLLSLWLVPADSARALDVFIDVPLGAAVKPDKDTDKVEEGRVALYGRRGKHAFRVGVKVGFGTFDEWRVCMPKVKLLTYFP